MAHQNSILSQDPAFFSASEYEEREEESGTQRVFTKVLFQLFLVLSILLVIYFAFNYISNMNIDFKKFTSLGVEKHSSPPIHEIKTENIAMDNKIKEQEVDLKSVEVEPIVEKVIEKLHQEKELEVSKIELEPIVKPVKEISAVVSDKQEKTPYLSKEYLEAVKKALVNK